MQFVARYYQFGIKIEEEKYIFCLFYENQKIGDSSPEKNNCISDLFLGIKPHQIKILTYKKTVASITLALPGPLYELQRVLARLRIPIRWTWIRLFLSSWIRDFYNGSYSYLKLLEIL